MKSNFRSVVAWPVRKLRRFRTRLLHPIRRRRTLAELWGRAAPDRVLFICHGNICRSPYAEAVFNRMVCSEPGPRMRAYSAGFIGPGRSTPDEGQAVARASGIDLSSHRSRLITQELVDGADLVVVMQPDQERAAKRGFDCDGKHVLVLGDLDSDEVDRREIIDPFDWPESVFKESYDRIERCTRALVRALTEGSPAIH